MPIPTKNRAPSDTASLLSQNAHIVLVREYKAQALWLLEKVGGTSDGTTDKMFKSFTDLTIDLPPDVHSTYDKLQYYYAWKVDSSRGDGDVTLAPVAVAMHEEAPHPKVKHLHVKRENAKKYHQALVLRKYLTLTVRKGVSYRDSFEKEWNSTTLRSMCFDQFQ